MAFKTHPVINPLRRQIALCQFDKTAIQSNLGLIIDSACVFLYRSERLSMFYVTFALVALFQVVCAFKWPIDANLPAGQYFTFSERYMFATKKGPLLMDNGDSFIKVQMHFNVLDITNHTANIVMAVFAAEEGYHDSTLEGLCDGSPSVSAVPWAKDVEIVTFLTDFQGMVHINTPFATMNSTYYQRSAKVDYTYKVKNEMWHNVVFVLCTKSFYPSPVLSVHSSANTEVLGMQPLSTLHTAVRSARTVQASGALTHTIHTSEADVHRTLSTTATPHGNKNAPQAFMTGTIVFHNPYGYIPAELYGMLPFQIARMLAYIFFGVFFVGHYVMHRDTTLNLHHAFLLIFFFALVESILWFASYQYLNIDGVPYCCPFSPVVVASLVFQCVRQTLSRCLLLVVCLGYGIVRPKLLHSEWIAVGVITTLYLICTLIAQGALILYANDAHNYINSNALLGYKVPEMLLDVVFLTWIYLAVNSTVRILSEFNQTAKLLMYKQLVSIIGVFVVLFTTVTFFFMIDSAVTAFLPWQVAWLEQVIWETLNFAVLAAVCVVCRPTANSQLLSYASQLPTEDPDMYDSDEEHGLELPGPWRASRDYVYDTDRLEQHNSYSPSDEEDSMEQSTHAGRSSGVNSSSRSGSGGKEIQIGDYHSANQHYKETANPMYRTAGRPSLSKYSPTHKHSTGTAHTSSGGYGDLPGVSDEEYGLEQDDL